MMNIVFITMMYGTSMPIIFPVAVASYLVLYVVENYMMYYVYKLPPAYDEILNEAFIARMKRSPLVLLAFSYWMLTNKQLLGNNLQPRLRMRDPFIANHYWYEGLTLDGLINSGPGGFLGIFFWIYLIYSVYYKVIHE